MICESTLLRSRIILSFSRRVVGLVLAVGGLAIATGIVFGCVFGFFYLAGAIGEWIIS